MKRILILLSLLTVLGWSVLPAFAQEMTADEIVANPTSVVGSDAFTYTDRKTGEIATLAAGQSAPAA